MMPSESLDGESNQCVTISPVTSRAKEPEGYVLTPRDKDLHRSVFGPVAIIPRRLPRKNEDILISTTVERRISMKSVQLQQKRRFINGKVIIGIDPAKTKHQLVVIDTHSVQLGKSCSFGASLDGHTRALW
jgi:hypothetical protein